MVNHGAGIGDPRCLPDPTQTSCTDPLWAIGEPVKECALVIDAVLSVIGEPDALWFSHSRSASRPHDAPRLDPKAAGWVLDDVTATRRDRLAGS